MNKMREIEVKILEIDKAEVENNLIRLGAKKIFDGELTWSAFDFPDHRFSGDELLRLRKEGDKVKLTHKRLMSREGAKTSEETEIEVSDYEKAKLVLEAMGLREKKGYPLTKHRTSYKLDGTRFEIDTYPDIPTYLEIEAGSVESAHALAEKLGFKKEEIKPWGVRQLFEHYRKSNA